MAPRKSTPKPERTLEILDRLLLKLRSMSLNGEKTELPTIKVILLQLLQKDLAGDRRARNALLKYREFAGRSTERELEVRFAGNSYEHVSRPQSGGVGNG